MVWLLVAALTIIPVAIALLEPPRPRPSGFEIVDGLVYALIVLNLSTVGTLIVRRLPRHPIGWLFAGLGFIGAIQFGCGAYAVHATFVGPLPGSALFAWVFSWSAVAWVLPAATFPFLFFPNGRLLSARWRVVAWLAGAATAFSVVALAFRPGPLLLFPFVENPFAVGFVRDLQLVELGVAMFLVLTPICGAAVVVRFLRATGEERQQLKWFASGAVLVAATNAIVLASGVVPFHEGNVITNVVFNAIPITVAIGILRYRLYDIDLIINRTLVYGSASTILAAVFVVISAAAHAPISALFGERADLVTAAIGVGLALLFPRLRRQVTPLVDRFLPARELVVVFFTDIVGSVTVAGSLGDERWRTLLERYRAAIRRELQQFHGREIDTAGDGFFVTFGSPTEAVRFASAAAEAVAALGLHVRSGLHLGPCEMRGEKISGVTVHIGARVMALAGADEVLVTSTIRDAVDDRAVTFEARGSHTLRGIPEVWPLYAIVKA